MDETISYKLSRFAYDLKLKDVPQEVITRIKLHFLDTLGIMMAAHNLESISPVIKVCKLLGGPPESTIIGHGSKIAAPNAAMANATMAHSLDYDDTHLGSVHQGCVAIPVSVAVGEKVGASGEEVLEAVLVAYEVNARLGLVAPGSFHIRGFHPTPVLGVFGAALAAGKLMGLSIEQLCWALGIAGSMSSGIGQTVKEGIPLKAMHPGIAAHGGVLASLLASEGYKGPVKVFEGEAGFFNAYLWGEKINVNQATLELGNKWETLNTSLKPYPSCHATHSAIDAAITLKKKYGVRLEDLQECICYLSRYGMELTRSDVTTAYGAKFSIKYCVSVALKKGFVGIADFTDEAIKDKCILEAMQKIKVYPDEKYDTYVKERMVFPAKVRVKLKDNSVYEEEVIDHKGTPHNPLTWEDTMTKFVDNIKHTKFYDVKEAIVKRVLNIEKYCINDLTEILSGSFCSTNLK
ncbi:MAG: MmgE/PrpD family protein [Candidatus Bathyarchaeia archaeon]|nr:MmgE/PrpD family protein [Candidatus Bathyarchaeota archaeon]